MQSSGSLELELRTPELDPLPTTLVKACSLSLSSQITTIIHSSLTSGFVLKSAAITPILKKPGADPNNFNNLHPISNLPFFLSFFLFLKSLKRQLHLRSNSIQQFQSGFHPCHSTVTARVKITNDLLVAADSGLLLTILILLDLSAAFDTISHNILIDRLVSVGFTDSFLDWFKSYLSGRTQFIQLKHFKSELTPVATGVPQSSVLGPILFIICLLPLGHIFRKFNISTAMRMTPSSYSTCPPNLLHLSHPPPSLIA